MHSLCIAMPDQKRVARSYCKRMRKNVFPAGGVRVGNQLSPLLLVRPVEPALGAQRSMDA
jgi:hypothetical protein